MTPAGYVVATCVVTVGIAITSAVPTSPKLVWNLSKSVPLGLYAIDRRGALDLGDLVAVMPPEPLAQMMVERSYIGRNAPILKYVLALPGQTVCRTGSTVTIDGGEFGDALDRDRQGRDLPVWQGCRRIADGDVFLMNTDARDSFDGRYFGPLPASAVIGRATPICTDEEGDGHFVWHLGAS